MIYGFIIAAGKQSRFNSDVPKAVSPILGTSVLDINLKNMNSICDKVYVACSHENQHMFNCQNKLIIESGYGCGDAVLRTLKAISFEPEDVCIIQWGDSLVEAGLYKEVLYKLSENKGKVIIPCEQCSNPYVQIVPYKDSAYVKFSKYGQSIDSEGLHDLSTFAGYPSSIIEQAEEFKAAYFNIYSNSYIHRHGNEFQFLDLFNDTELLAYPYDTQFKGYSFNTVDELKEIAEKLGAI